MWRAFVTLLLVAVVPFGCGGESGDARPVVHLFAPASLEGVLTELIPDAERELGVDILLSPAGSGTLAGQIIAGAPADLFISANGQWMDELDARGLLQGSTRVDLLENRLVLIGAGDHEKPPASLSDLARVSGRIAIGEPTSVPAGQYALQALKGAGVWESVESRVLPAMDVRAALAYVAAGEAEFGIVYVTDLTPIPSAASSSGTADVKVLLMIPAQLHEPIVYPAAVLERAANPDDAQRVLEWLQSKGARAVFRDHGFAEVGRRSARDG